MSAAASRSRRIVPARGRARLRARAEQIDRAMVNGRIPALLVVIVTGLLLYAFLMTDDYRVEAVTVDGVRYGNAEEVVAMSEMLDRSSFEVNLEQAAAQISTLPYIESVSVELHYPGRASITVHERRPEIIISEQGRTSLVSASGMVIAEGTVEGLPLLQIETSVEEAGEALPPELVDGVRSIATIYGPQVTLIWNEDFGLAMESSDGRTIIFGEPEQIEAKLTVLGAIEERVEDEWTQLDLRVPTRPAYR